jgi:hypothetical protein
MKNSHLMGLFCIVVVEQAQASKFQIRGNFECSVQAGQAHPNANIQLWEEDTCKCVYGLHFLVDLYFWMFMGCIFE